MLPNPFWQITRNTDIECAVTPAGENVDKWRPFHFERIFELICAFGTVSSPDICRSEQRSLVLRLALLDCGFHRNDGVG